LTRIAGESLCGEPGSLFGWTEHRDRDPPERKKSQRPHDDGGPQCLCLVLFDRFLDLLALWMASGSRDRSLRQARYAGGCRTSSEGLARGGLSRLSFCVLGVCANDHVVQGF